MLFFKRLTLFISSLAVLFTITGGVLVPMQVTHAQVDELEEVGDVSGLQDEDLRIVVAKIIRTFLTVLGVIAVVIVLYGGFMWMTARGEADKVDKAKKILLNGFIGLAIILLSWSITTFVLNALLEATGGDGDYTSSDSGAGGSYGGGSVTSFAVAGYSPEGEVSIRNVVAEVTFSRTLDEDTVEGNITITNTETGDEVSGTLEISGNSIEFMPSEACPEPNEDRYCFDENTQYTVTVDGDIESSTGTSLDCAVSDCTSTFTTGELVDTEDPDVSVTYPESGENISTDSSSLVQVSATDDSEISSADFYAGDDWFDTVSASGSDLSDVTIESTWYTDDTEEDTRYTLEVTVTDIAGNEDTDSVRIKILPAHCFNGTQDEDEEGTDCGGSCGSCDGDSCEEDDDCASGTCEDGTCVSYPEIESISPSNGAVGTYVTISGSGFGTRGSVYFSDGAGGTVEADIPTCGEGWWSDQIIAEVPEGADDGPITVEVSPSGYTDSTDNDEGTLIDDFDVNETERPNLCNIAPDEAEVGDAVTLSGLGFGDSVGDSSIYFDTTEASSYSTWSDASAVVTVPSLTAGEFVDVSVTVDGVTSNEISFGVEYSDEEIPTIYSIDPEEGGVGQYVTISGTNFGAAIGSVWFEDQTSGYVAQGSVDFPDACEDDYWSDDEITIIVPEEFTNESDVEAGDYDLYITTQAGVDSDDIDFTVTDDEPTPGICAIDPDIAEVDDTIIIYGQRLGSTAGSVEFYSSVFGTVEDWDDDSVTVTVPSGTQTGPVSVTSSALEESNELNFEVGTVEEEVAADVSGGYAWYFSTGDIPDVPTLLVECSDDLVSAVPNLIYTTESCTNTVIRASFSTVMDEDTISTDNIKIFECSDSRCNVDFDDDDVSGSVYASSSTERTSFTWTLDSSYNDGKFKTSTSYLVWVTDDLTSYSDTGVGQTLEEDVTWTFTTGPSEADCEIEEVMVSPTSSTIEEQGEDSEFNALPLQECQVLNPASYGWDWDVDTYSYIGLTDCEEMTEDYCISAVGVAEGITILTAEESDSGTTGDAEVTVNFEDPYVSDYQPDCSSACVNGAISATFNVVMDDSITDYITLYSCSNELCAVVSEITTTASCSSVESVGCSEVTLTIADSDYGTSLKESEFYRVVVSGSAISNSGVALTRTNYGDDFSWTFGSKDDDALCLVSSIALAPENQTLEAIGDTQHYEVTAYGDPDSCSVAGQELSGYGYDWSWTDPIVSDEDVAEWVTVASSLFDVGQTNIPDGCTSACTASGSETYYGICGNGSTETGEDCDDWNTVDGDGCSSSCQYEGTDACVYTCSSTGESCSADTDCQEVCEITDTEALIGTCSISETECSLDTDCTYAASTCDADSSSCCGDGDLDTGEECDDNNSTNGDGCSSSCLNEGSQAAGATCGNSDIAHEDDQGGEDCDDGNASSGDGCSSICLNEGTTAITQVAAECGDGTIDEPYETCDDSNTTDGDGCSSSCIREGADADYASFGSSGECGDEILDQHSSTSAGEDCDGEEWCSDDCLLSGSSIYYTEASVCGDGIAGYGELDACEGSSYGAGPDGYTDPVQLALISTDAGQQVDMSTNLATATVQVTYDDLTAYTSLYLSCVAEDDDDCDDGYGPATTLCCMERPDPELFPNGSNACLNAEIYGLFNMKMETSTFEGNVFIVLDITTTDDGTCPSTHSTIALGGSSDSWWQRALNVFTMIFAPIVHAQTSGDCILPITGYTQSAVGDGVYKVVFNHDQALAAEASYTIYVTGDTLGDDDRDGVLTSYGVAMDGDASQSFETYQSICGLDEVDIIDGDEDSPNAFTEVDEEHTFTATAYSYDTGSAQAIEPISGYTWEWTSWSSDDDDDDDGIGSFLTRSSESVGSVSAATADYTSTGSSGEANIATKAIVTEDTSGESFYCSSDASITGCTTDSECQETCSSGVCSISGESCDLDTDCEYVSATCESTVVSGTEDITIVVCDNPWPALDYFPFEDNADGLHAGSGVSAGVGRGWMNFSTYYCRDAGEDGDTDDDYPELRVVMAQERGSTEVLKEYFFNVVNDNGPTGDAIGVRFVMNSSYLSPMAWYYANGFSGNPTQTTIDGFQAVVDGRSTYVAVPNYVTGSLYPNIAIISYNYGASSTAVDIFDMMLENLSLVTNVDDMALCYSSTAGNYTTSCESDLDCTATGYDCADIKSKLMRDMDRLGDVTDLAEYMSSSTPQIESGSFVRSLTSSVWGSWDDVLATDLGVSVDSDPLDSYQGCGSGRYRDYDETTCVDEVAGEYLCPRGSRTYHYRAYGDSGYVIGAELEFKTGSWFSDIDSDTTDDEQIIIGGYGTGDGFQNGPAFCDGSTIWGASDICGDGIVGSGELCEVGDTTSSTTACDSDGDGTNDGYYVDECDSTCAAYSTTTTCDATSCGNGVTETGEDCDDGSLNGSYGFCGADCLNTSRTYCGDGTLAGGEACDCGSSGTASGAAYGGGSCTYLNGVYDASASNTCAWDCSGAGPYCGDGDADDEEDCDGTTDTYSGMLCTSGNSTDEDKCDEDSDCIMIVAAGSGSSSTGQCGETDTTDETKDTANECPYTTVCVDGDADKMGEPCDTDGDCDSSGVADGICSSIEYQTTRTRTCDDSTCLWAYDWADIDCIAPGSCGDGVVDDGEECDDGNDDSTDSCTIECTENICGDGYVYDGEESCDEGSANGTICTASYGSTCAYCNDNCVNVTSSGSFCGDGEINGDEVCDADDVSYYYYDSTNGVYDYCDVADEGGTVEVDEDGEIILDGSTGTTYTCTMVGVCNGGSDNGDHCMADSDCEYSDCALPVCNDSCANMCPFTYTAQSIALETNELGAKRTYTTDISPFDSSGLVISTGNSSTLYIPECTVSDGLTMTINDDDREYPDVEIMFVIDLSKSMSSDLGDSTRIEVLESAVGDAITALHEAYDGVSADMGIGWAYIGGLHQTYTAPVDTDGDGIPDDEDNCPDDSNPSQLDTDGDGVGDECEEEVPEPIECDCGELVLDEADCEDICGDDDDDGGIDDDGLGGTDPAETEGATGYDPSIKDTKLATLSFWDQAIDMFKPLVAWASYSSSGEGKFLMLEAASSAGVSTTESDTQSSITSGLVVDSTTGTPIYESIEDAALGFSGYADNEYMIIFTDGNIYNTDYESLYFDHIDTEDTDGDDVMDTAEYMRGVSNILDDIKDAGVEVFSAVLSDSDCEIAQMQRWSSMECTDNSDSCGAMTTEGNHDCEVPDNGITYAYSATTSDELVAMYEAIVDAILNVTISLTFDGETESTTIEAGLSRSIELPTTFSCDGSNEQTVTLRTAYNGEGTVELSDIYLNMCAQ